MRAFRFAFSIFVSFLLSISLTAQQVATSSPQALALLQKSLAALAGSQTLTDVTLTGTVRRIVGSDDDNGTAVLKALASGASRTDLALSSGQRSEILNTSVTPPEGAWSGPDGVSHSMAFHNLLTGLAWFFPAFAVARRLPVSGYSATYIGHETHNAQAVEHVSVSQQSPSPTPPGGVSFEHLSEVDFFLDSTTLLPSAISFNIHPDNNALLDIPVKVQFSDYRPFNGAQVPHHIQKLVNNTLILDFQVQTVTFNSGMAAGTFAAQ